jgi:hypothetical protein
MGAPESSHEPEGPWGELESRLTPVDPVLLASDPTPPDQRIDHRRDRLRPYAQERGERTHAVRTLDGDPLQDEELHRRQMVLLEDRARGVHEPEDQGFESIDVLPHDVRHLRPDRLASSARSTGYVVRD